MNRTNPYDEIANILLRSAATDERSVHRMSRVWDSVCNATYASDLHPVEHFLSIVLMLQDTGNLSIDEQSREQVLTELSRCGRVGSAYSGGS